jgi:hypothetical protein
MSVPDLDLRSGDVVEIKDYASILLTLDSSGALDGLPFMPEMKVYCGRRFRVHKRADRICVETEYFLDFRRLKDAVLLEEVRCDGSAHDGCRRLCLIFWKEAWLTRVEPGATPESPIDWTRERLVDDVPPIDEAKVYSCQSTALLGATTGLRVWDPRQYLRDLRSRALKPLQLLKVLSIIGVNHLRRAARRYYDWGSLHGTNQKTPRVNLDLRPGEMVRVKDKPGIVSTLDPQGRNRGLYFGVEMNRHCGATLQVITPVDRMILEANGRMKGLSNTVLLKGAECSGLCNHGCARYGHPLWREAWLERLGDGTAPDGDHKPLSYAPPTQHTQ